MAADGIQGCPELPDEPPAALEPAAALEVNDIGQVRVRLASELPIEEYATHRRAGAFLVIDPQSGYTLAAGIVTAPVEATAEERAATAAAASWVTV